MSEKKSIKRTRNYASIVYPDSAPFNWKELLADELVPAFISPLHDKDINPTGIEKKAHYHVMLMFDGPKTQEQATEIFQRIGAVGCEVVQSPRGYARYLCHLDNPEKVRYDTEDVTELCGADYHDVISLITDRYRVLDEIIDFCVENGCDEFADLVEYSRVHRREWFRILADSSTVFITGYLKSVEHRSKRGNGQP